MCAGGVIHSLGDSRDIRFMCGLSVYMPFTSRLIVSYYVLCGTPLLSGFYSRDFTLEIFSTRYINMFGFFVVSSTGLTVCYFFRLFYFVSSCSLVETSYNMVFDLIDLLIISILGGSSFMRLIFPTPSVICLRYYLKFLPLLV